MLGVSRSSTEPKPGPVVLFVRWGLPIALIIAGIVCLILSGGHLSGVQDNASESNVFTSTLINRDSVLSAIGVAAIVIALMVWLLNWMLRMNADEAGDRAKEDEAREYLRRHGHWPDER
ncbi:MAG TPA: hypothetical protein VG228_06495 [Solirubrobacteraceae bacterium]|nr:hypothetical protein [Solirubrobacteraceae bacterium]